MEKVCRAYIKHARLVGALYSIVPTIVWFVAIMIMVPFRQVYLVRLGIAVVIGGSMGAFFNLVGVRLWLARHHSKDGPGKIYEGSLIGAAIGLGAAVVPALTSLIYSNHLEEAKTFIIISWLGALVCGGIIGSIVAGLGVKYIDPAKPIDQGS